MTMYLLGTYLLKHKRTYLLDLHGVTVIQKRGLERLLK